MGMACNWFRSIIGSKNPDPLSQSSPKSRRRGFVRSSRGNLHRIPVAVAGAEGLASDEAARHAIAVAVATAAAAEVAVSAAQAAAAVVRLTSGGGGNGTASRFGGAVGFGIREEVAAIKIQSNFRAYLARRALRALKAVVKLQALARGNIVRKQTADMMCRMQALLRAQMRARASRSQVLESALSGTTSSHSRCPGPPTPEKTDSASRAASQKHDQHLVFKKSSSKSFNRVACKTEYRDDEKADKIVEVDDARTLITPQCRAHFKPSPQNPSSSDPSHSFTTSKGSTFHQTVPSSSSYEANYLSPRLKDSHYPEETPFCTAENTPLSSVKGLFTPSKSDSRSCLSSYSDHPNYMACTESSKAKIRSFSAPRQRPFVHGYGDLKSGRVHILRSSFASKAYPGSGRLDRLGIGTRW